MTGVQVKLILLSIFAFGVTFGKHIEGMDVLVEKLPDDSNEFKIKYGFFNITINVQYFNHFIHHRIQRCKLDNGEIFHGETLHFHDDAYIFYSANGTMYGISLTTDERDSNSSFFTFARPGNFAQIIQCVMNRDHFYHFS